MKTKNMGMNIRPNASALELRCDADFFGNWPILIEQPPSAEQVLSSCLLVPFDMVMKNSDRNRTKHKTSLIYSTQ